jgi:hypothetical protein
MDAFAAMGRSYSSLRAATVDEATVCVEGVMPAKAVAT